MHECCTQCVDNKCDTCLVMNLEEEDSSDANNEISNEGNTSITNEQRSFEGLDVPMMFCCDVVKTEIGEKTRDALQMNVMKKEAHIF